MCVAENQKYSLHAMSLRVLALKVASTNVSFSVSCLAIEETCSFEWNKQKAPVC